MAAGLDRQDFDNIPMQPLSTLHRPSDDEGGRARVHELTLPNGTVRVALSSPSLIAVDGFSASLFGAELVAVPDSRMTEVRGLDIAMRLRAVVEDIVKSRGFTFEQVLGAMPKPSAAGLVNRVGGSVEELIVRTAEPFIARAHGERLELPTGTRWIGPGNILDYVKQLAFIGGIPAITGEPWPPRAPNSGDPDLTVDVGISAQPDPDRGLGPDAAMELRFIFDPVVYDVNWWTVDRYWLDGMLLNVCFIARDGPTGIEVFHAHGLGGETGGIRQEIKVAQSTWAWVTSVRGTTTYEFWGTCNVAMNQPRWIAY